MAEQTAGDKTEQPTPERLRKAREEGKIPQSGEVGPALSIIALLLSLALGGPMLLDWSVRQVQKAFACRTLGSHAVDAYCNALSNATVDVMLICAPFLVALMAASVAGSVLVGGWTFAPQAIRLDFSKLSPSQGLGNLFSMKSGAQAITSLIKLVVLSVLVWIYLQDKLPACMNLRWSSALEMWSETARLALGLLIRLTVALSAIAAFELLYQRHAYKKNLRMTRQEIKQERKQHELAPEVRGKIRRIQFQMARKRMLQDVKRADVVLANPTHVAVALRYQAGEMPAPQVLAKGADHLAEKIKELAREHNVPVVEKPELARALFATVEVGQTVPQALFLAVAEVLAMIYRLKGKRVGKPKPVTN